MLVKKIIPIEYENAINEVKFDMMNMFPDEENKQALINVSVNLSVVILFDVCYPICKHITNNTSDTSN